MDMTLQQSEANQTGTSREQEKNYRGVRQLPNGKYKAQIHDRKKGATIFLGTFNTDIEAAKAFDRAAIRLRGSAAVLNLPEHEARKSSSKGCEVLECSRKKIKKKEKGNPVESTISNAEHTPRLHIPNTLTPSSTLSREMPSIVKNIATPPPEAILNITLQQSANKAETSMEQGKQYRGLRRQSTGKYGAKIRDPQSKATTWLGKFKSGIEAAKALDRAAVSLHGSRAILNFPEHEAGKSSSKGSEILQSSCMKRMMEEKGSSMGKPYRGAYRQPSGRYRALIRDKGTRISLGSFDTDIEAAKAYDRAAFRLHGVGAVLNFPLEAGKASSNESKTSKCSCWERKIEEMVNSVESSIDDVEEVDIESSYKKKSSIVKNIAVPPPAAILNVIPQRSLTNKAETSMKQEKQFRGVRLQSTGKYGAKIRDPKSKATIWLGTFNSDIEAAKAFDSAAIRLHGSGAILNFPEHDAGKSSTKGSEILKCSHKKRKMGTKGSSVGKHYRGAYRQSSGKYRSEIRNKGARVSLGTFNTEIEAAKAYDRAAFRLHGIRAVLNFPLEAGKSSSAESESSESSCKERRIEEMVNSVDCPVDDVEELEIESSCNEINIEEMLNNVECSIEAVKEVDMESSSPESGAEAVLEQLVLPSWKMFCYSEVVEMFNTPLVSPFRPDNFPWLQGGEQNPLGKEESSNLIDEVSKVGQPPTRQALELCLQVLRWDIQDSWLCGGEKKLF